MNEAKTRKWLKCHQIELEESFVSSLRRYAKNYKKIHGIRLLDDVYRMVGVTKQDLSWWEHHPCSVQTKKF